MFDILTDIIDSILKYIPGIEGPDKPLSLREKLRWTLAIMVVYFMMFSIPALGANTAQLKSPVLQLISIIFAARIGSLITVGIGPIVFSSIVIQLLSGAGVINIDMNDPEQKGRFQGIQKTAAILLAFAEAYIFTATGYVPILNSSLFAAVVFQLAIGAVFIIYLDEMMTKYGITSGINLFIAGGVAYSIVAGTINIILGEAIGAIQAGGASAIPNAILAFGPFVFAIVVFLVSIYAYDIKVELPLVFSQMRGVGGRLPIPFLYVSVLPVILATSFEESLQVWLRFLAGTTGTFANLAKFLALYSQTPQGLQLTGGLVYLISPNFPLPYSATYGGIGNYNTYLNFFMTSSTKLYLPLGGIINVPEWMHVVVYAITLIILCIIFGKFWVDMTGQSSKHVADQLQDVGWQIPGFRRDPRIVKSVLDKYIPTITVLGSIFVALLAVVATLTGAVGTGMGILLTVGIMYMVYQQLEQEKVLDSYPALNKMLS